MLVESLVSRGQRPRCARGATMLGHWLSTACSYLESASNLYTEGTGEIIFITSPAWESEYNFSRQKLMFATYYISVALPQDSGNARTKKSTCVGFKRHRPKFYYE